MSPPAGDRARPEVHISETEDGVLARFAYDADAVDVLKSSRTAVEWAAWVDEIGGWRVPRAVWRRAEQRLRALSFDIVPLSLPTADAEEES